MDGITCTVLRIVRLALNPADTRSSVSSPVSSFMMCFLLACGSYCMDIASFFRFYSKFFTAFARRFWYRWIV